LVNEGYEFDLTGMGESLLFGFLLGERTLFKNVNQLRPATLIIINENDVSFQKIHDFNFENRKHEQKKLNEIIDDVSDLFSKSCINRLNNKNTNLVALSSGLDSRTVAACLYKNGINFTTATMVYKNGHGIEEVDVAKQIASLFKVEWNPIEIEPPSGRDIYTLLNLKEGMVYLAAAPILPFYKKIKEKFGSNVNYISGDKGDKITLTYDIPIKKFGTLSELVDFILGEHSSIIIDEVCSLFNIKKDDIIQDLIQLLKSYPEKQLDQKYIHFRAIEKSHKLAFQGDDRHKKYFWNYCPLTSVPFVHYLFNCSDESKKFHRIFTGLLKNFSDEAANILYTNFKAPITSLKADLFMYSVYYLYTRIPPKINSYIKNQFFGGNPTIKESSIFYNFIKDQFNNTKDLNRYFNISDISDLKKYRMSTVLSIMTISSLIEDYIRKDSTLTEFADEKFDYLQ
jgi:asparagine synthase (glutamine-hydrolysing)